MTVDTGCGCKGIRFCAACENTERVQRLRFEAEKHESYPCYIWVEGRAYRAEELNAHSSLQEIQKATTSRKEEDSFSVNGLMLIPDFLSVEEEKTIMEKIDGVEWVMSQSGRRKQDYGPQVNFKHKKVKTAKFVGMPDYADFLLTKMKTLRPNQLDRYRPLEMCNLEYDEERKSAIELHQDDMWIWGNRLISINLINGSVMTLTNEKEEKKEKQKGYCPIAVALRMDAPSIVIVHGRRRKVRYDWKHGVLSHHIQGRRIALTMREAAPIFQEGGDLFDKYGKELLEIGEKRVPLGVSM